MKATRSLLLPVAIVAALAGALVPLALYKLPSPYGLGLVSLLACWGALVLWPWAVLPVTIIGGTMGAVLVGRADVGGVIAVHLVLLVVGLAAVATRWLFGLDRDRAIPLRQHRTAAVIATVTVIWSLYGLAAGNAARAVAVAAYLVAVIPLYFVVTLLTVPTARDRRLAFVWYTAVVTVLAVVDLTGPEQHAGLLGLLPIPTLVGLIGATRGWKRVSLLAVVGVLGIDVLLSANRGTWLIGIVAGLILVVRGDRAMRKGLAITASVTTVVGLALAVAVGMGSLGQQVSNVTGAVSRPAGYRGNEAEIGLDVFLRNPAVGAGLGQSERDVYLDDFGITDVGPDYHAYPVMLLANLGLLGALAVVWPIASTAASALRRRRRDALVPVALTAGFLLASFFTGPTDGHWELGVLAALTVLAGEPATRRVRAAHGPNPGLRLLSGSTR